MTPDNTTQADKMEALQAALLEAFGGENNYPTPEEIAAHKWHGLSLSEQVALAAIAAKIHFQSIKSKKETV